MVFFSEMILWLLIATASFCQVSPVIITGRFDEEHFEKYAVDPNSFDVLLRDLPVSKMKHKTKSVFHFEYNSFTTETAAFPIDGVILKDPYERIVIPIIVAHKKQKLHTACLADTGSPYTYMSAETLRALKLEVSADDNEFDLNVHGLPMTEFRSVNSFEDITLCGQSFF
eukprot:gene13880-16130_t